MIAQEVAITRERSGWTAPRTLTALGVRAATYYRHRPRADAPGPARQRVLPDALLPTERAAILSYARRRRDLRHRALAWTMIDQDIAYASASTVYRVLREAGLIAPWEEHAVRHSARPPRPTRVNELWQVDLRYVRVAGHMYYLLAFLDVHSRFVVYHELLRLMDGRSVSLAAQAALEQLPENARAAVRIQSDNGSAFVSGEFARTLARHGVGHHRIHPHTPEQNAFVERFMRTIGDALPEPELTSYHEAVAVTADLIRWYNEERLHSGIAYVTPQAVYLGHDQLIQDTRRAKLRAARQHRRQINVGRRQPILPLPQAPSIQIINSALSHFP